MKTADLYIRVSTDEQADKGYSQRSQEEVLRKYCENNHIIVRQVIYEDHSAKTFNRPEWTKLLAFLRRYKNKCDLILFTKWDRFSRNAPDAYQMIATLKTLGVEPQAIEQPLDMSVPENKMMLAIYLTAPEIENDRRALNVFYGMRRAKKEGRWMATAPIGYVNRTQENGKKQIVPQQPQADIMKWVFKSISEGNYATEQIWKAARTKGLKCSKHTFWVAIRNPAYCGKIVIPQLKDEPSYTVDGLHEPLISEALFKGAQLALDNKRRIAKTKISVRPEIILRGLVKCSNCTRILTGSGSKGRKNYYYYYHCSTDCGYRQKAEDVHESLMGLLDQLTLHSCFAPLFKEVITDVFSNSLMEHTSNRCTYLEQIEKLNIRLQKARELLLNGDIDSQDYKLIKDEAEGKIADCQDILGKLGENNKRIAELKKALDDAIFNLTKLNLIYKNSSPEEKRQMVGSMFSEKFTFEELKHRTAILTDTYKIIYLINSELGGKKNGTKENISSLCHRVIPLGLEPRTPTLKVLCSTS